MVLNAMERTDYQRRDTEFLRCVAIIMIVNSHLDVFYPIPALGTGGAIGNSLFFMLSSFGLFWATKIIRYHSSSICVAEYEKYILLSGLPWCLYFCHLSFSLTIALLISTESYTFWAILFIHITTGFWVGWWRITYWDIILWCTTMTEYFIVS